MPTIRSTHAHAFLLAFSALAAGCGGAVDTSDDDSSVAALAATPSSSPDLTFHPFDTPICLTDLADGAPMMHTQENANGNLFDSRLSNNTAYNGTGCAWYIADLAALSSYTKVSPFNTRNFVFGGGFQNWSAIDEATCPKATVDYTVHKRTYNVLTNTYSAWTTVHTGVYHGWWDNDPDQHPHLCRSNPFFTYEVPTSSFTRDIYRMTVLPKINGVVQPARIDWQWTY
jgi:hypothetical protein